ncbi:MAG: hypothetical protein HeimC3_34790 [Candidatus Heimdallarchaeota archaeon LC_3]|nr:MAG: hypothetical protein HeimC3_34790 [Candidatus Heimdallarchaeota archaeon LC_3]
MNHNDWLSLQTEGLQLTQSILKNSKGEITDDHFNYEFYQNEQFLEKFSINPKSAFLTLKINKIIDLYRIIGIFKNYYANYGIKILYRGQNNLYNYQQRPNLFRNLQRNSLDSHNNLIRNKLSEISEKVYNFAYNEKIERNNKFDFSNYIALEGVLQHYNEETRFIDLVDDLRVALWFSFIKPDYNQRINHQINELEESHIFLYGISTPDSISRGVLEGSTQRLINLREATPPTALRPHIQQASVLADNYLFSIDEKTNDLLAFLSDYRKYILCVISIKTDVIRKYLYPKTSKVNLERKLDIIFNQYFPSENDDQFLAELNKRKSILFYL